MGSMRIQKKNNNISLSLFYLKYFMYLIAAMILLAVVVIVSFNILMNSNVVYPADYAQNQATKAYDDLLNAYEITADIIPDMCDYALFDMNGNIQKSSLTDTQENQAWKVVTKKNTHANGYYYTVITREKEYLVIRYKITPQYRSKLLQKIFIEPQPLIIIITIAGMLLIIIITASSFGKELRKRLAILIKAANKVEQQELDFEISKSGINEIDAVLKSMDNMRAALKDSLEKQWKIEQEKNEQMSALAHDLKTPLTIVRGNTELILENELTDELKKYAEYIENSSLQMQNYVQTLIEVTKSYQGYQFNPKKINISELLEEIKKQTQGLCTVNGLTMEWSCNYTTSNIVADHDLLIRAVINVVSNAVEHTAENGLVSVSVDEKNELLIFKIIDSGKGFSAEAMKHGAEQFYMDDASRNSKTHFGIGLYAAKTIIEKHCGKLELNNDLKTGGAKVTISIPLK